MWNNKNMLQIQTKLTSQGQVSVPAAIRHLLALTPGSAIVWTEDNGRISVQRAVKYTSEDAHKALFGDEDTTLAPKSLQELKQSIAQYMTQKHARR
jgi:antitoxin PrlF